MKEQLTLDPDDATPVADIPLRRLCAVTPGASILDLLNLFQVALPVASGSAEYSPGAYILDLLNPFQVALPVASSSGRTRSIHHS